MIVLSKLNGEQFVLNSDFIEKMEETPDTVITLVNEKKYIVRDRVADIISKIVLYKRELFKSALDRGLGL